jgi:hypothetical protein
MLPAQLCSYHHTVDRPTLAALLKRLPHPFAVFERACPERGRRVGHDAACVIGGHSLIAGERHRTDHHTSAPERRHTIAPDVSPG